MSRYNYKKQFPKIFKDWHPTLNKGLNPNTIKQSSTKKLWWRCSKLNCGHNWQDTLYARVVLKKPCPKCAERNAKVRCVTEFIKLEKMLRDMKRVHKQIETHLEYTFESDNSKRRKVTNSENARQKTFNLKRMNIKVRKMMSEIFNRAQYHKTEQFKKNKKKQ